MQNDDEIELKKKIALYYHPLFQSCLAQWFLLLQQENYSRLNRQQYMEVNVRIQKSLILDFDLESAQQSAKEDWKIDVEREKMEKKEMNPVAEEKNEDDEDEMEDHSEGDAKEGDGEDDADQNADDKYGAGSGLQ